MMTGFRVTPTQLEALGAAVGRVAADVRGEHQSLRGQLSPLFGTDWAGAAAAQFTALYEQFDLHARGMSDALDGIGQLLRRAGLTYADVEQQVAASFG
jgi:WXG100 family type VII secretion target